MHPVPEDAPIGKATTCDACRKEVNGHLRANLLSSRQSTRFVRHSFPWHPNSVRHSFVKCKQSAKYEADKLWSFCHQILLWSFFKLGDFAENYTCVCPRWGPISPLEPNTGNFVYYSHLVSVKLVLSHVYWSVTSFAMIRHLLKQFSQIISSFSCHRRSERSSGVDRWTSQSIRIQFVMAAMYIVLADQHGIQRWHCRYFSALTSYGIRASWWDWWHINWSADIRWRIASDYLIMCTTSRKPLEDKKSRSPWFPASNNTMVQGPDNWRETGHYVSSIRLMSRSKVFHSLYNMPSIGLF